jgi:hypothetical protein
MNTIIVPEVKTIISTDAEAKEMGQWDAQQGNKCDPDAYAYSDEWQAPYWRSDYVRSYIVARGL